MPAGLGSPTVRSTPCQVPVSSVTTFSRVGSSLTGQSDADYTIRQAAYDLRKLRGKQLVDRGKPRARDGRCHDYSVLSRAVAPPSTTNACPVTNDEAPPSARK